MKIAGTHRIVDKACWKFIFGFVCTSCLVRRRLLIDRAMLSK